VFGTVGGLVLGAFFSWAALRALSDEQLIKFAPPIPLLIVILLLGAAAGVLAAIRPASRDAKLDVLQAIATE